MADRFDPNEEGISDAVRAKRLKRQQTMQELESDPVAMQQLQHAHDAVMGRPGATSPEIIPPRQPDAPAAALPPRQAPATAGELMGKPTVPGEPIVRGRSARIGMPRGGGGTSAGPVHQIAPQLRPNMPNPDQPNPLGLGPNSPFKYEQGGMVKKHGSSTHVPCATKHR